MSGQVCQHISHPVAVQEMGVRHLGAATDRTDIYKSVGNGLQGAEHSGPAVFEGEST